MTSKAIQAQQTVSSGPAPGNTNALKSGHSSALSDYHKKQPFSEIARVERERIAQEIDASGLESSIESDALSLAMLASLFERHVLHIIADRDDVTAESLSRVIRDAASLTSRSQKAKALVLEIRKEKETGQAPIIEVQDDGTIA